MTDARLSVSLPSHPKTKKLIRQLGEGAAWRLVCLILWTAANRPDGNLGAMAPDDIELAADWPGEEGAFTAALLAVGFLDETAEGFAIHDWAEHQPWVVGSEQRSRKARWNAIKRHHGEAEADRQEPEYAARRGATSNADSNARSSSAPATSNAPSPSPSPSPKAKHLVHPAAPAARRDGDESPDDLNLDTPPPAGPENPTLKRINGEQPKKTATRFPEFWACYPVKKGKPEAEKKWKSKGLDALADQIIAHVRMMEAEDDQWKRGFIPHGSRYVNGELWNDEPYREKDAASTTAPPPKVMGAKAAMVRSETPLEAAIGYIRQQRNLGVYGEGEHAEAEMRRLIAEATEKHRATQTTTVQGIT